MLKLACIKLGDDELGNNYFTLSQLDRLPMECQLQLANGDALRSLLVHNTNTGTLMNIDPEKVFVDGVDDLEF